MKKLFFIAAAIILIAVYTDFSKTSMPVIAEKKILYSENKESISGFMPEMRVMSYNIHRGINKGNELDLDGIVKVIQSSGAEIIALQEVERFSVRTGFRDQIKYIAEKLSMQHVFGKSINILNGQYGNAILSKYPIEEYKVSKLPSSGERRTVLRAALNINGERVAMYSTHLGLGQDERALQLQEITRIIGEDKNCILAGDFNSTADKLGLLAESHIDSGYYTGNDTATFKAEGLNGRIDYIFVSKDFEVKNYEVLESDASDHNPVISTLKLKE